MANEVLYRKWRPRRFSEVSGQDTVMQTLRQAVSQQRVAHAYLFCGPRGTGKTSTARILAKAINCLSPKNGEPDATCSMCVAIDEGRALDLIEIDAASHRGVDDARSLRERVFGSGPAEAKSKVYIIDEVHMLSNDAFNTLLKTLEEPPPWAVFILCTTEAHKLLPTIVSRCQRFDFRRITPADTMSRLEEVCKGEKIVAEPEALQAMSRAAGGSLRDACNLLEQLTSAYGRRMTKANVDEMLGLRGSEHALPLVKHVLLGEAPQALELLSTAGASGMDLRVLHREMMEFLRAVLLLKSGAGASLEHSKETIEELRGIAQKVSNEALLRAIRAFAQANVKSAEGIPSLPLELAVIEACMVPQAAPVVTAQAVAQPQAAPIPQPAAPRFPPSQPGKLPPQPARGAPYQNRPPQGAPGARPPMQQPGQRPLASQPQPRQPEPPPEPQQRLARARPASPEWDTLLKSLKTVKGKTYTLGPLLGDCSEYRIEGNDLVLVFRYTSNMERLREEIEQPAVRAIVKQAVKAAFSKEYEIKLLANANGATPSQPQGHLVRAALALGSRVIDDEAKE